MLADAAAPILLTHGALRTRLPAHHARVVDLDADRAAIARAARHVPPPAASTPPPPPTSSTPQARPGSPRASIRHACSACATTAAARRSTRSGRTVATSCWSYPAISSTRRLRSLAAASSAARRSVVRTDERPRSRNASPSVHREHQRARLHSCVPSLAESVMAAAPELASTCTIGCSAARLSHVLADGGV